ncbi:ferrichrome ABC transporter ATP-binding protein [Candidatus Mycoplasma haematolamae str. Purdue]|uniref:Ferrichrome ABC transporter ATP-binding protein n=1 Tax=Mycoplasma haematolamae (strain Purdue) TaxID=1212765 RepID=I7CIJ6_MYCHA|nr:ABC transporter ATP-binding protein [Candidatus Mycoplasma haematolamae]AFO51689.1 ferrichrome ABC transporter ATP-binding protein [Candidatus Mycoplasma haematolamae str. Purdue]
MKYSFFSLPIKEWEVKQNQEVLGSIEKRYLKTSFPAVQLANRKMLLISNLSFSYSSVPGHLFRIYKRLSSHELFAKLWDNQIKEEDKRLLKNINLSLASGKFIAVVGRNGSGKSTIAKIVVNLLSNYEGQVIWSGKELQTISIKSFAQNVSYIPQSSIIYNDISLLDFIAIGFSPREGLLTKISQAEKERQIMHVLSELNLQKEVKKSLYTLSGGNKQKAIIARSIIQGAKIIVLDEPLNFLDIKNKILVLEYLKSLQVKYGTTIVMIHHDLDQVKDYLDEVVVVDSGFLTNHIRLEGSPRGELLSNL